MNENEIYECDYLPGEQLIVSKRYNSKQAVLKSNKTGIRYMAYKDLFSDPKLSLAHVGRDQATLRKKEEKVLW
jgi:phosphopantetheinyl transferase (holo-ACP synthase)